MVTVNGKEYPEDVAGSTVARAAYDVTRDNIPVEKPAEDTPENTIIPEKPEDTVEKPAAPAPSDVNWRELEDAKPILTEYEALKSEKPVWDSTKKQYETRMQEMEAKLKVHQSELSDPALARLDHLKRTAPEDYKFYRKLVDADGEIDPVDLIKIKYMKENPEFKEKPEKLNALIRKEYGLNLKPLKADEAWTEGLEEDEIGSRIAERQEDIDARDAKIEIESKRIRLSMLAEFDKIPIEPKKTVTPEEISKLKEQHAAGWSPVVDEMVKNLKSVPVFSQGDKDKEAVKSMDFVIPDGLVPSLKQDILDFCVEQNLPLEVDSINKATGYIVSKFTLENLPKIIHAAEQRARSMSDEEWAKKAHNPSASTAPRIEGDGGKKLTLQEEGIQKAAEAVKRY
jgi:hypothetical protein